MAAPEQILAVLLAGGQNRRFGSHKALAPVGGVPMIERSLSTLDRVCPEAVIIANDFEPYEHTGRRIRPDKRPGMGALGGILSALHWAADEGCEGALVLACDMPFVPPELLAELVRRAEHTGVTVAESDGPRGVEPLCAVYGTDCLSHIEQALDRDERAVVSFFSEVPVQVLDRAKVGEFGRPERMFFNVNRPDERNLAEELL
jgi:molybdopterin-guanine dinucleotide biosynthesis protein A